MKFTTKIVVILFIILTSLGIFLYFLNNLTKKQQEEEENNKRAKLRETEKKKEEKIKRRMEKNANMERLFESFLTMPFNEADSKYGKNSAETADAPPEPKPEQNCPDILIHRGDVIVLYNSKSPETPVAVFKNLDEYAAYVHKQQADGNYCPVLYLRKEIDLQGRDTYRMYPLYIPHQVSIYDQYSVFNKTDNTEPPKEQLPIKHIPSVHYPIRDGDLWSNGGLQRPSMPMPPPFLKSMGTWEIHHMPPLYVEGGLPPKPIERKISQIEVPNVKEIPMPMSIPAAAAYPEQQTNGDVANYDPYALAEDTYISSDKVTTPPPGQYSDNAYDSNWGGVLYTHANVEAGKYDNNAIKPALYPDLGYV